MYLPLHHRVLWLLSLLLLVSSCYKPGDPNARKKNTPTGVALDPTDHLILKEIHEAATWVPLKDIPAGLPQGYVYEQDQYIIIYNPTKETVYLDGLALVTSRLQADFRQELSKAKDRHTSHFMASGMAIFPGKGQEHPLAPGAQVLVCAHAIDHRTIPEGVSEDDANIYAPNSMDLRHADFEWATHEADYPENPKVANMLSLRDLSQNDYLDDLDRTFHMQTGSAVALIRPAVPLYDIASDEDNEYIYSYARGSEYATCILIPSAWVIDAVAMCPRKSFQWQVLPRDLDRGRFSVHDISGKSDAEYKRSSLRSIVRKHNGQYYEDSNNSTVDFEQQPCSQLPQGASTATAKPQPKALHR